MTHAFNPSAGEVRQEREFKPSLEIYLSGRSCIDRACEVIPRITTMNKRIIALYTEVIKSPAFWNQSYKVDHFALHSFCVHTLECVHACVCLCVCIPAIVFIRHPVGVGSLLPLHGAHAVKLDLVTSTYTCWATVPTRISLWKAESQHWVKSACFLLSLFHL